MKRVWPLLCCLFAGLARAGVEARDDSPRLVRLPAAAQRIVSLAPHATELMFAAGAGDRLIAADEFSDFPSAAKALPRIGRAGALDVERIVALKPDLVIAWGSGNVPGQVAQLRRFGIPVFVSEPRAPEDVASTLRRFGALAGTPEPAGRAAAVFESAWAGLRREYAGRSPVSVFYQIWDKPLMTVNGAHLISKLINVCGGRNVFADVGQLAPTVDTEAVLRTDPQAIVGSGADERRPAWLDDWKRWPGMRAVRDGQLHDVPPQLIQRHGPRLIEGTRRLCEVIDRARGYSGKK